MKEELRLRDAKIVELNAIIAGMSHKKGSHNSSMPPSSDIGRKPISLREKSDKKTGGQKGHEGTTLKFSATPHEVIKHISSYCPDCGQPYTDEPILREKRQVVDIPPIELHYTEHVVYERKCKCGKCSVSDFPQGVNSPISYGSVIESLCGYFSCRKYISISRIREIFTDVFKIPMSEGTIVNKINTFAAKCMPLYEIIRQRVQDSTCIGTDETGCRVNGQLFWMWTWQTKLLTYIAASSNRGNETITKHFKGGFKKGILVHDCWKPQMNTQAMGHQICLVHLLRELKYFIEKRSKWAYDLSQLFHKSIRLKRKILENADKNYDLQIEQIQKTQDALLKIMTEIKDKKLLAIAKRVNKYRSFLFTFLKNKEVPPDNNASEQAIRNVKVKLKVSGLFRTEQGASQYAIIRSVIDTALKNKANVLNVLSLV
ncbi:MAG TPA: IS66 family transposase [Saprospiraceae bacterium]|nr:IS66 family transposase [Saprospiraceae bacterium]HRO07907.1 IS66 family transposase [Saprospiraceae bacterium]HRP41304.1 IS66 family transposase [Saprospiraceae bacterium]